MIFKNYFHEKVSPMMQQKLKKYDNEDHKIAVWNAFVDSSLDGVTDDDFSILPRLIPESYLPVIEKTCFDITKFLLSVLSLPAEEIKSIVPEGPVRNFMIHDLEVLKYQPKRMTGSFRFDMAIVGEAHQKNPPKLLEVNEIGFDGLARSTFFQNTLMSLIPELTKNAIALNTAEAEVQNMNRLGRETVRLQYDCYNWDEEFLKMTAEKMHSKLHLVSPSQFKCRINKKDFPLLKREPFHFEKNGVRFGEFMKPDAFNMSFAFTLSDLKRDQNLYREMVRSKTPQYGPFITSLIASKTVLILLSDKKLRNKLIGSSKYLDEAILTAFSLDGQSSGVISNSSDWVIKHTDGCGGEQVFMDKEMVNWIKKLPIKKHHEWVVQQKTKLNLIDINGILSKRRKAISDLGVFIQYDWQDGKFTHFKVGGLMCRATNKSLKVNVSGGGSQVAVMLEKGK
jgi:hypothetical protein